MQKIKNKNNKALHIFASEIKIRERKLKKKKKWTYRRGATAGTELGAADQ